VKRAYGLLQLIPLNIVVYVAWRSWCMISAMSGSMVMDRPVRNNSWAG
jgi:hypothetical protein